MLLRRIIFPIREALGSAFCELAFKIDCRGLFA
jgi:hypothetical protein